MTSKTSYNICFNQLGLTCKAVRHNKAQHHNVTFPNCLKQAR